MCPVLVESLNPRFALFLVTALMLEQPVLLVAPPGSDELLMQAGESGGGGMRGHRLLVSSFPIYVYIIGYTYVCPYSSKFVHMYID